MAKNRYGLGRVKRYRHSFYDSPAAKAKRILKWVLGAAAVFVVGFLVAPAVLNWGTHAWYTHVKGRDLSSSSAPASSSASASASSSASGAAASESAAAQSTAAGTMDAPQAGSWSVVSLSSLTDSTAIAQTAQTLKSQGVRYALIQLKDASGYVYYASGVASASGSIAASTIDAAAVAQAMTEQDIIPVAYICAFQDPIAAYTDRTMGIHYTGSDYMWLDAKADAGGKPWLNPYSASAVQYVGDLVQEALDMGYKQVVLSAVQFPAYVSDKQDFGDTAGIDRAGQLTADIAAWSQRFAGKTIWYEVPYANCAAQGTALGSALPGALGMTNLVIQMPVVKAEADSAASAAASVPLDDVVASMKASGCTSVVVRDGTAAGMQ